MDDEHGKRYFGLIARCTYTEADGDKHADYHYVPFNDDYDDWQFASGVIVPDKYFQTEGMTLEYIDVYVVYDKNFNTMSVDNISLRQEPCTTYTYNADGNATAVNASGSDSQTVEYVSGTAKPSTVRTTGSGAYYYQYLDTNNKYLPSYISNATTGVYTYYGYDKFGNNTETHIGELNDDVPSSYPKIKSYAEYSEDGSQLVSETNGNGQTTTYLYNAHRDLLQTTDSNGTNVVTQEILTNDRPYASYISGVVSVHNTYTNGLLSRIKRGGYITGNTTKQEQYYNMSYDSFGNMTEVSIGADAEDARVLASYSYGGNNNDLDSMTYGNGDSIEYTYDDLDRMTQETWDDGTSYLYMYNAEGALAQKLDATDETKVDNGTADAVNYQYDSLGRLIYSSSAENGETTILTEHLYDRANRIDKQTYQLRNHDGTFTTYVSDYTYRASQIANIAYSKRDGGANFNPFSLAYTYDALGNIKTITGTGISGQNASYVYDVQSQLTSAVVDGKNYSYEYDTYGNIRKAVENGTTHTYTYGDADWKDLLTAYDGQAITYDEIGNPTSYYNGTRWDFDWEKGRQLVSAESDNHEIEYTYDMAGIRDSKTVDGVKYNYLTLDGKVVRQTWKQNNDEKVFDIIYDANGQPYACVYEGYRYYYVLNQQGDVIQIVGSEGTVCAEYRYDAWGNVLSITGLYAGTLGAVNPIRYRGYYYDTETGFYYLQSRYYDPSIGRFINADQFASTGQGFLGCNMFAYCYNNPICYVDNSGSIPVWAVPLLKSIGSGLGVGALAGVLSGLGELITGGSKDEAVEEAKNGFAIGLISYYVPVVGVITTVISAIDAGAESRSAGASKEESILVVGISLATSFWQMDGDGVPYNVMNEMLGFSGSLISNSVSKGINGKAAYLQKNNSAAGNRCTTGVMITAGKGGTGGRSNRYVALM